MATNEIKNLEEGRIISLNSSDTLQYNPEKIDDWEYAFNKFKKMAL